MCGLDADKEWYQNHKTCDEVLDVHHITPREDMPNGGYVKENGITLCKSSCHMKAEEYLQGVTLHEGFSPEELYKKIDSTYEKALQVSDRRGN